MLVLLLFLEGKEPQDPSFRDNKHFETTSCNERPQAEDATALCETHQCSRHQRGTEQRALHAQHNHCDPSKAPMPLSSTRQRATHPACPTQPVQPMKDTDASSGFTDHGSQGVSLNRPEEQPPAHTPPPEEGALPIPELVLEHFPDLGGGLVSPLGAGLINQTYLVELPNRRLVLQRVNPIFSPRIHETILLVTERLQARGLATPLLVKTADGLLCLDLGPRGVWRVLTFVEGVSFNRVMTLGQAFAAATLVARFHAALEGLEHCFPNDPFPGFRSGVHDTPRHLGRLREALTEHQDHRLFEQVAALAARILKCSEALPPLPELPDIVGHGDLKFNNIMFAGPGPDECETPRCLIDLDTVGPVPLAYELGDALRSWCNRAGEDQVEAVLDLDILQAVAQGYEDGRQRSLAPAERNAVLLGPEWVSLELAARFAADALRECYFGWDPARFPGRGEHNLHRARGQLSLHEAFVRTRPARAHILRIA